VEHSTIYCKNKSPGRVTEVAAALFTNVSLRGAAESWEEIVIAGDTGEMRLTKRVYEQDADPFTDLQYRTYMLVHSQRTRKHKEQRQVVLSHIHSTELILGVVVEPDFEADPRYPALLFQLASELDGLVFNGRDFLDAHAEVLCSVKT
jgi:hypothetical protein